MRGLCKANGIFDTLRIVKIIKRRHITDRKVHEIIFIGYLDGQTQLIVQLGQRSTKKLKKLDDRLTVDIQLEIYKNCKCLISYF